MRNVHRQLAVLASAFFIAFSAHTQSRQPQFWNSIEAAFPGFNGQSHLLLSSLNSVEGIPVYGVQTIEPTGQSSYRFLLGKGQPHGLECMPLSDGFLIAGSFFQCDIDVNWTLYRYNASGNLLWSKDLGFQTNPRDTFKLLPLPDNGFWLFRQNNAPIRYTADGEPGQPWFNPLPLFRGYRKLDNDYLLVYGEAGLGLYSPDFFTLKFGMVNIDLLAAEPLPNGHFAALSADSLFLVDEHLQPITQTALNLPAETSVGLCYAGGRLQVLAASEPRQLLRFDTANLSLLEVIDIPLDAAFQPDVLLSTADDQLLLAGHENPLAGIDAQVIEARISDPLAMPDFDATAIDAGVTYLETPKMPAGKQYTDPINYYTMRIDSVSVWVKNDGAEILEKFTLNSVLNSFPWQCGTESTLYKINYQGLNILPGDSLRIYIGKLFWEAPWNMPASVELCFWTTLPNDSLDANPANNKFCRTLQVTVPTVSPEQPAEALFISPNPASDRAVIQWENSDFAAMHLQVFNAAGALVKTATVQAGSWEFERGALPAGLYHILIRNTENGQLFTGRLLWH
ncbi:MAG: T9SS type A sorting domain-containing protein [Lewinellaceae bacterium]|nr:T9SS type A sorting domain-containing protein [Lewinellaceae bacterium]